MKLEFGAIRFSPDERSAEVCADNGDCSMTAHNAIINELEDALSHGSAERRVRTLRRVTDLFVFGSSHFSSEHVAVFDRVFNHLIADIELSARETLADRLAGISNAPPKVIRTLAFDDEINVAGPVLAHSDQLDNVSLVENARTKSQKHLLAISRRKSIAETVTDVLVERGNRDVALSTAQNEGAQFSETGYVRLVKRSEGDDTLAQSVGLRAEIPRQHFLKLLTSASQTVRQALEVAHPQFASEVKHAVAAVTTAIQAKAAAASRDYAEARKLVESMHASGRLGEADIEAFARLGKFEETAVALALLCDLPIDIVERAMVQDREETILIIAKAIGLSWPTVRQLLRVCAGKRGLSAQMLQQSMAVFYKLKRETAQKVIDFQRKRRTVGSPGARR
jgi:uncharacterized protein (DUF2336 family)